MFQVCVLASGSQGNATWVRSGNNRILFDCGISALQLQKRLSQIGERIENISGVFISHEHLDHIRGIGALSRKWKIPLFMREKTLSMVQSSAGPLSRVYVIKKKEKVSVGDAIIHSLDVSHDAVDPMCFSMHYKGKKLSLLTDLGNMRPHLKRAIGESNCLIIECNYDTVMLEKCKYPKQLKDRIQGTLGHLSNYDAANAVLECAKGHLHTVILAHLSEQNNNPKSCFDSFTHHVSHRKDLAHLKIHVAQPNTPTPVITI